jgi:hypothetical protein
METTQVSWLALMNIEDVENYLGKLPNLQQYGLKGVRFGRFMLAEEIKAKMDPQAFREMECYVTTNLVNRDRVHSF